MQNYNNDMPIYKAAKRIACLNAQLARQVELMSQEIDPDGIEWNSAELVSGLTARDGRLYSDGFRVAEWADEYYVNQHHGYSEDSYSDGCIFARTCPGSMCVYPLICNGGSRKCKPNLK